jgi:hypothetical protein
MNKKEDEMLTQPTMDKLIAMRLRGMADAFGEQQESADSRFPPALPGSEFEVGVSPQSADRGRFYCDAM